MQFTLPTHLVRLVPIVLACVMITASIGCIGPCVQQPCSDVPVIANIKSSLLNKNIHIDNLSATVVDAPLNLFNSQALIRFRITGHVAGSLASRPYIKEVYLSERIANPTSKDRYGDLLLIPIASRKKDKSYKGEPVPFDVKVEQIIESLDWGSNRYVVVAGEKQVEFTLHQKK